MGKTRCCIAHAVRLLSVWALLCPSAWAQFGEEECGEAALLGQVYRLPPNTQKLPDFQSLAPVDTIYASTINIPKRRWSSGFPNVPDLFEWFAIEYTGAFTVRKAGNYTFRLVSDDGSRLFIDGQLIVNNDGVHPTQSRSGSVFLEKSLHTIALQYFQGPRFYIALQLFYTGEEGEEQIFPGSAFELRAPPPCGDNLPERQVVVRPNPFTPNDDGFNDGVEFNFAEFRLTQPSLKILNFEGRLVRTITNTEGFAFLWDGRGENGEEQPPGVYLYIVEDGSEVVAHGSVTLAR